MPAADAEPGPASPEDDHDEPQGHDEAEPDAGGEDSPLLRRLRARVNEENDLRRSVRWVP
ncbi:hypothetical protein HPT28_25085 [Streptomyces sp. JJ38]|nr:hypothetical protein [Streptomyces sp. JJ38]